MSVIPFNGCFKTSENEPILPAKHLNRGCFSDKNRTMNAFITGATQENPRPKVNIERRHYFFKKKKIIFIKSIFYIIDFF